MVSVDELEAHSAAQMFMALDEASNPFHVPTEREHTRRALALAWACVDREYDFRERNPFAVTGAHLHVLLSLAARIGICTGTVNTSLPPSNTLLCPHTL